jgi:hypothetical protein
MSDVMGICEGFDGFLSEFFLFWHVEVEFL